jgi:hypothetical protein
MDLYGKKLFIGNRSFAVVCATGALVDNWTVAVRNRRVIMIELEQICFWRVPLQYGSSVCTQKM